VKRTAGHADNFPSAIRKQHGNLAAEAGGGTGDNRSLRAQRMRSTTPLVRL